MRPSCHPIMNLTTRLILLLVLAIKFPLADAHGNELAPGDRLISPIAVEVAGERVEEAESYPWLALSVAEEPGEEQATTSPSPADSQETPDEESFAERFKKLEEQLESLRESHEELQAGQDRLVTSGHSESKLTVYGRIHADLWGFPGDSPAINGFETGDNDIDPADRLGFRRLRIGVQGEVWKNMIYRIETEMANGNDFEFRDAYLGFKEVPILQEVQIGNQKRPYNLDQINSSRYNVFMERPFIGDSFEEEVRRFGICSYGVSDDQAWNWRYGWFNLRNIQDEGNYISDHWQSEFVGRLANTFWYDEACDGRDYGHWAISGAIADLDPHAVTENYAGSGLSEGRFRSRPEGRSENRWLDTGIISGADHYYLLGFEGLVNVGPTQLVAENMQAWVIRNAAENVHFQGSYFYWSYFLTGEYMAWDRETGQLDRVNIRRPLFCRNDGDTRPGWGAWQVAVRWSYADFNDADIFGGIGEAWTLGLNWYWNDAAKMQFNYIHGRIDDNRVLAVGGHDSWSYDIVGTRFLIDF